MYARVVRSTMLPGRMDDFMRVWEASVLPALKASPGFQEVYVVKHSDDITLTMMILWDDEATAKASLTGIGMPPIPAEIHIQLYHYRSEKRPKSEFGEVLLHA